jgi:ABC-type nickel/cobalt efflux system permease component RcnA
MKKIIVLILVLGLAMPVSAWHLFPVKEKPVTEKKDNSVLSGVILGTSNAISCVIGLLVGAVLSHLADCYFD